MTLRTGKPSGETRRQRAFTLVELIVVMTLLVVMVSIAAPTLANFFRGRTLDSEVRLLLSLTRHGQSRAASEGVPMVLWVDAKGGTYGLEAEPSYEDQDTKAVDFALDKDLHIEVANANVSAAKSTIFGSASANSAHAALPRIRFLPDGSFDEASLQSLRVLDRNGASLWLAQSHNRLNYEIRTSDK